MDLMDSDSSGGIDDPRTVAREVEKRTQRRLHRWKNHRNAIMDDDDDDDDHDEMNSSDSQKISPIHRHKHIINCSFSDSSDGSFDQLLENLRIKDDSEESSSYTQENCPWPPNVSGPRNDHIDTDSSASMSLSENRDDTVSKSASPVWTTNDEGDYQLLQHPLPKVCIPKPLFDKLYDHQKEGIEFLARLHASGIGGILGDDMGMGKTFMTLIFLNGLFRTKTITSALIVAPVSVIHGWEREAKAILSSGTRINPYRISMLTSTLSITNRRKVLQSTAKKAICITTYGMVRENKEDFIKYSSFDYVVLDEGHTIKNDKSQISQACREICFRKSTRRLILTGTPIMNNLRDLWALFDFATSGKILGDRKHFWNSFANPIEAARDVNATESIVRAGEMANQKLQEKLKPYFLQRLKADILADRLPPKTELIVWTHLSELQRQLYSDFVKENSMIRKLLLGQEKSPLVAITSLKKLCGHPLLFHTQQSRNVEETDVPSFAIEVEKLERSDLIHQSTKLEVLREIVKHLLSNGHKILVFSQSTCMLDIIEKVLQHLSIGSVSVSSSLARIDGSTSEFERQRVVKEFNAGCQPHRKGLDVLLLSTKAAGVGLTLNAADRVILFDPSWSPAEDAQAVDRCYRIGQTSPVVVYRLIAAGSVEEKMYEKQIYKDGIRRTVLGNLSLTKTDSNSYDVPRRLEIQRYFDATELRKLFELCEPGVCKVMEKLQENLTADEIKEDWGSHDFLLAHPGVVGLSRHDGFYNRANIVTDIDDTHPSRLIDDIATEPTLIDLTEEAKTCNGGQNFVDEFSLINLLEDDTLNHATSESFLTDTDKTVDENDDKDHVDESQESECNEGSFKENCPPDFNVESYITSNHDAHQSSVSEKLEKVNECVRHKHPRRALQILTDILQTHRDEISNSQEEEIHQKIVHLASTMQLNLFA